MRHGLGFLWGPAPTGADRHAREPRGEGAGLEEGPAAAAKNERQTHDREGSGHVSQSRRNVHHADAACRTLFPHCALSATIMDEYTSDVRFVPCVADICP